MVIMKNVNSTSLGNAFTKHVNLIIYSSQNVIYLYSFEMSRIENQSKDWMALSKNIFHR